MRSNIKSFSFAIDPNLKKLKNIFYKLINVTTDFGILTSMPNTSFIISVYSEGNDFSFIQENDNQTSLVEFNLFLIAKADLYNISFIKLQDVFASIGGIITFINLVFSNIALIFNLHDKNTKLVNKF